MASNHNPFDLHAAPDTTPVVACHESHPTLQIPGVPGTIRGGSARRSKTGFDTYINLDAEGEGAVAPWRLKPGIVSAKFGIINNHAPRDAKAFKVFVEWLCTQVRSGRHVHIGCIGGHGRTGLVLSAMYVTLTGDTSAIQWVRANHCAKAVESEAQVQFLVEHFGCKPAPAKYGSRSLSSYRFTR